MGSYSVSRASVSLICASATLEPPIRSGLFSRFGRASMAHGQRPLHPREVHQGALYRERAGCGIFPALPKGRVPDRGRELAKPAIGEYRVHHEAAARADRERRLFPETGWSKLFEDPVTLPNGRKLVTLLDAGNYIASLRRKETAEDHWQAAIEALMMAAEDRGPLLHARVGMLRALKHGVEPVFNSSRKDPHWKRRKLARNQ